MTPCRDEDARGFLGDTFFSRGEGLETSRIKTTVRLSGCGVVGINE